MKPRFLTQKQAEFRASYIENGTLEYRVDLALKKGSSFSGTIQIKFQIYRPINAEEQQQLFLDFDNKKIEKLEINGEVLEDPSHDGLFVKLPWKTLKQGANELRIQFESDYATDGEGLHSFTDIDQKQYCYSHSEPYFCNRIFPCFDQPDLKGRFTVLAEVPDDWIAISNEKHSEIVRNSSGTVTYQFPATKILPTYLLAVLAGPYVEIRAPEGSTYRNIPMSLFTRQVLIEHLHRWKEFIFEVTNQTMRVFEDFFQVQFPFNKYDQIFCPEFNMGAMENAGCVTFNDAYVFKEEVDSARVTYLAVVIAHELAHHWFGNLVTMKWWNDLWLNESFAEFISYFNLSKCNIKSRVIQSMTIECLGAKEWGYETDQMKTTHPIAGEVANTEVALNIFDGITYSKGAACLKQLMALIGEEKFGRGLKTYFTDLAFKNSTLDDFISHLNQQFHSDQFDLLQWKESWICTAGLNICEPLFKPGSQEEGFIVRQTNYEGCSTLRNHKIQVCLFEEDGATTVQDFLIQDKSETYFKYETKKDYRAVLLNYGDHTFIKLKLDSSSLDYFLNNFQRVTDQLTRSLIWTSVKAMVVDGDLRTDKYLDFFEHNIFSEKSVDLVVNLVRDLHFFKKYTPQKFLDDYSERTFNLVLKILKHHQTDKNIVSACQARIQHYVQSFTNAQILVNWYLKQNQDLNDLEISVLLGWNIVLLSNVFDEFSQETRDRLFQLQTEKDASDDRVNYEFTIRALRATEEERESLWKEYTAEKLNFSMRNLEFSWEGFNHRLQQQKYRKFWTRWVESINQVGQSQNDTYATEFFSYLVPKISDEETFDYLENQLSKVLVESEQKELISIKKAIQELLDEISKRRKTFKLFN